MTCVRHDLAITSPVAPFLLFSLIKCGGGCPNANPSARLADRNELDSGAFVLPCFVFHFVPGQMTVGTIKSESKLCECSCMQTIVCVLVCLSVSVSICVCQCLSVCMCMFLCISL